ncbi:hypothetical protein QJQ45_000066 [Haematococcus lacustris]|nr:hypothetical protein QJQ45_000066 [Haematococcus lacustris]
MCVHYTRPLPPPPAPPPAASSNSRPGAAAAAAHAGQVKHASGLNNSRRETERWLEPIQPHLQHLAAASSASTSLEANLLHITVTLATWDVVWEVHLDPEWTRQRRRLYGAQDRALEQFFKMEEENANLSMKRHGRAKQLVVFFGAATIGTRGGWGADAMLRACCKVVCRPRGIDQRRGRVVLVDEHRTSRPLEVGPSTHPPAKRSKRTKAEQAAEPTQPTKGKGKALGKAAKAKPAPQPGRWLDRNCNAALNMQRIGESRWRPLELCYWGIDQRRGRVVLVDEHRTSRVSSAVNGQQPCEGQLDRRKDTRPAGWKPPAGQPLEVGPSTHPPAKRSKHTKAEQAAEPTQPTKGKGKDQRPVRVYLDGCFDMMHYGHANALRQAKTAGDQLVVGLIPDSEILRCKGPPVQTEDERLVLVDAVKWVDEVITGVPYDLSPEFLHELFTKHRIDYIVHGDDPCLLPDGTDAYAHAKALGRFRMIKRTEGVSTTDIVGRMLTCTRVNPTMLHPDQPHPLARDFSMGRESGEPSSSSGGNGPTTSSSSTAAGGDTSRRDDARTTLSKFLPTSRRLVQFSNGRIAPEGARIVYIDGAFDVFHPGHVKILKAAKAQGEFLLVGLHTDEDVQERRGPHLPIMNLHERSLSVLACKFVDEVIMGSPTVITDDLIKTFNIHLVDRYAAAQSSGIFRRLVSPDQHTARDIIQRIVAKRQQFEARNAKKARSSRPPAPHCFVKTEAAYYSDKKEYVAEL